MKLLIRYYYLPKSLTLSESFKLFPLASSLMDCLSGYNADFILLILFLISETWEASVI